MRLLVNTKTQLPQRYEIANAKVNIKQLNDFQLTAPIVPKSKKGQNVQILVLIWCFFSMIMSLQFGSPVGFSLNLAAMAATFPPLWRWLERNDRVSLKVGVRLPAAFLMALIALAANGHAYNLTPEGRAALAARRHEQMEAEKAKLKQEKAELAQAEAAAAEKLEEEAAARRNGDHCFSGWDGAVLGLKDAVKSQLRNPDSFDHSRTIHTKPNAEGKIGAMMEYRAENGFGGMNVEAIAVSIDPETCDFEQIGARELERDFLR